MVSQNIINIILKMEDQATTVAQKADQMIKKFGNSAQSSNNKASQSVEKLNINYGKTANEVSKVVTSAERVGSIGSKQFDRYNESIQKSIVNFNRLDDETQEMLRYLNQMSGKGREAFVGMSSKAQEAISKFVALENETRTWGNTLDFTKTKLSLMGTNVDSVKGKVQVLGSSFISYVSPKVDSLSNSIRNKLSSAVSTVKSKIQSLGEAFNGVGGVISSVFGGIGLAAMSDMTIGASISRERIQSLSFTTMGFGQTMEYFADNANSLWNQMDNLTNSSLVSLDQLSQAASVVAMSTHANETQMQRLIPILNDIGQKAILMGKSGDEAMGLMQAAGKGLNGEFEMLRENFGINKEMLENAGWSGSAEDIDGYTTALEECLRQSGNVSDMMNTTHGNLTRLKKMWSVSARSLGDDFKPIVDQALDSVLKFVDANNDGKVDAGAKNWMKYAAGAMTAASAFATLAPSIAPALQVFDSLTGKTKGLLQFLGIMKAEEDALTLATLRESVAQKASAAGKAIAGAAASAYGAIVGVLTGKINLVSAATAVWNAILAMNPIILVVIALIALVAAIYEVGKAFGWWSNVQEMLDAIWAGIQRVWDAFINHPDVQAVLQSIGAAWNWICEVVGQVWQAISEFFNIGSGGEFDVVAAAIDVVTFAFEYLTMPLHTIIELIQFLYPYFEQFFNNVLVPLGEFLMSVFAPIWDVIVQVLTIVWSTMTGIIGVFDQFKTGQIDLPALLLGIWGLLSQMWIQIMMVIANAILSFAGQVWNYAVRAGTNFLNGVINYISQLPGRVWDFLVQTTEKIISAGSQWVDSARQKAGEMVNGAVSNVQQLPGKIYEEFLKVPDRIREAIPQAIAAALQFGKDIIDGVLNAMGIHSPGIAQNSIAEEFKGVVTKIKDTIKPAGEYAKQVGAAIVEKFGEPKLSMDTEDLMPYQDLDANPLENVDMADIDLSSISGGLDSAMGMTDDTNTMIGESYNALATMMMTTLNNMVLQDQLAYGAIQSNDLSTFQNISTGLNLNLLSMSTNLRIQLNAMLMTHRTAMNNATNTTRQQLAQMLSETMKVTGEMRSAWAIMADSIISAAARIRNEATAYFDQLSTTIGTFYRKLQNPSQWAGGDTTGSASRVRATGRDPSVMTRLTRGVANSMRRDNQLPYTISVAKAKENGLVSPATLEYMNKTSSDRINLIDLIQRGACPNCFAGWIDVADPNIQYIKNTAREWQMRGPAVHTGVGDIDTGLSFKVSDFESGTPHISWESFVRIATAIASAIPYDFYFNSDKYGSWQNAIAHGAWNCYDGASAMVALANTCGYSGYVDCGLNWGGTGHCAAIINGYTFDTTSMANRGGWANGPCSYSHPAPSAGGINVKIPNRGGISPRRNTNPLEGLFDKNSDSSNTEEVKLTLNHNVNVNVNGNTQDIDTNALIAELEDSVTDKRLIDKIADALIKRDRRISRMRGA